MTRRIIFAVASLAALAVSVNSFAHDTEDEKGDHAATEKNHHNHASRDFDYKNFDKIRVTGVYEIDVKVGGAFSVAISGPEKELERTDIRVDGNALVLSQKNKRKGWRKNRHNQTVFATITLPVLSAVDVSGVVDGTFYGIKADDFEFSVSGVGDIDFAGECQSLTATISGVGDVDAKEFECADVSVKISGVGDASVYASSSVDARISGMGDIDVFGAPKEVRKSGGLFSDISIR